MITWNCFKLNANRQLELELLLQKYDPDVAVITETDLKPNDVAQLSVPGYRCSSPPVAKQAKIRVLAFTKSDIDVDLGHMEPDVPAVSVRLPRLKLSIVGIYRQHHKSYTEPQEKELQSIKNIISALNPSDDICLAGDLNFDAGRLINEQSPPPLFRSLRDYFISVGLDLLPTSPTFKSYGPFKGKHHISTIDHIYVSSSLPASAVTLPDSVTDHFPVLASVQVGKRIRNPQRKGLETVSRRNLAAIDQESLVSDLRQIGVDGWPAAPDGCDVDGMIEDFYGVINPVIEKHAPRRTFKVRRDTPPLFLSKETREAMRARDRARQGGGGDYKMLRNKCVKLVRRDRMQTALQTLTDAPNKQAAAWRLAGSVLSRGQTGDLPQLKGCRTDQESATMCNSFFIEKVDRLVDGVQKSSKSADIMASARQRLRSILGEQPVFGLHNVGIETTKKAIRSMGTTKALGVDELPCSFWKQYCDVLAPFVCSMANASINSGTYPTMFKEALVIPVHKGGRKDKSEPSSYRPIAILPALSKVLETIVVEQLVNHLEEHGILPPAQHGFRREHSTVTALVRSLSRWTEGKGTAIASFDYSAAFDTISRKTVQDCLDDIGASPAVKTWMASYLGDGRQRVRWNSALSSVLARKHGVAQGSKAGPIIFILVTMVNFAPLQKALAYADDTHTSSDSIRELAKDSEILVDLSNELGLSLNPTKTRLLVHGKVLDDEENFKVGDVTIPPSQDLTLLGFTFDEKLSPQPYLHELYNAVLYRKHTVGRLSAHLPPHVLKMFARAVVLGKIRTYLHLALKVRLNDQDPLTGWGKKLQVVLNDVARILLKRRRRDHVRVEDLLQKSGLQSVNSIICSSAAMLAWRAADSGHPLHDLFASLKPRGNTRGKEAGLLQVPPPDTKNLALWNMATVWNAMPDLRAAKSEGAAKRVVKKFVRSIPI